MKLLTVNKDKKLTRLGLVENLKQRVDLRDQIARGIVDGIFKDIEEALKEGRTFMLPNVGTLKLIKKEARISNGFGKKYSIPERMRLKFTQSKSFYPVQSKKILVGKNKNPGGLSAFARSLNK